MKVKPHLHASAGTLDKIEELVRKFYGNSKTVFLIAYPLGEGEFPISWEVHNSKGKIEEVYVRLHKKRYRFESVGS